MFALKYPLSIAYTQALSPSRLTLYTEQIWYGLVLLFGPIEILFVHVGPKIPRIWVALHQMVHVGSSHIETPSIRRCRAAHRFPGQFHRFGIDVHWAGRIGSKELQIDCMGSFLHLRLGLSFHALDRFPKPWKVENVICWNFLNLVVIYFKFSPLNSLSKNLENCSRPTGSINSSRKLKPHRFTRLRDTSLLKLYNLGMLVPDEFGHVGLHK